MGATGSRLSTELLFGIHEYSKVMRGLRQHTPDVMHFRDLRWVVTVTLSRFNEETGMSDFLGVEVFLGHGHIHEPELALGTDISNEILDYTGLYTVFQSERIRATVKDVAWHLVLSVSRWELEASSCLRHDDCVYVKCTLKEQRRRGLLGILFSSSESHKQIPVAMASSHTLTVDSLSGLKAKLLLSTECTHSTCFAVGGRRWYLKLGPARAAVHLVRATNDDDETPTTAEFSLELEGAVNIRSEKMTHTFDRHSPHHMFRYQPPEEEPSTTSTDSLLARCRVKVIPAAVLPTAATIPAATILTTVPTPAESQLTPLLSAMHDSSVWSFFG